MTEHEAHKRLHLVARVFQASRSITPEAGSYLTGEGTLSRDIKHAKVSHTVREATEFVLTRTPDVKFNYKIIEKHEVCA
jgi:hypothetical protein